MAKGILSKPPQKKAHAPGHKSKNNQPKQDFYQGIPKQERLTGLTPEQNWTLYNKEVQDRGLAEYAGRLIPRIGDTYQEQFDWNQLPQQPTGDEAGRQRIEQATYDRYNRLLKPQHDQALDEFEQEAVNKGWDPNGELYKQQKTLLLDQQAGEQQDLANRAIQEGGTEFQRSFDIGNQAYQNQYQQMLAKRNMPLNEFNQLNAAMSPMAMQNLGNSQAINLQNMQDAQQRWMLQHTPHGGGGGGGGSDPYQGFGNIQNYWAAQDARNRANQEYSLALQQKYAPPQPSQPSYGASLVGQLGGALLGGFAQGGFKF